MRWAVQCALLTHTGCQCACEPLPRRFYLPRAEAFSALGKRSWSGARGSQLILTPESFGVVQGQWDPGWRRITVLAKPENLTDSGLSCDDNICCL